MRHAVPHHLDMPTSRRVADKAWESYSARFSDYHPTIEWITEQKAKVGFKAKGIKLLGELELLEERIEMDLEVPFLLRPFRKKALEVIEREIRNWVAKAEAGEI